MLWRAQVEVGPVQLEARRTAAGQAVAADRLALHALEDPSVLGGVRGRQAAVVRALEQALAGEADAGQALRRPPVAPPQAAELAVERVVVLARLGLPGADATLGATYLQHARHLGVPRDAPVEAVAAEIDEPAAAAGIGLQRVQRAGRVVLRVRAGQHRPVGRQQGGPLLVQVLVGDHVEGQPLRVQPGEQVAVRRVVPQPRSLGVVEGQEARPHGQHRPQPRGEGDAAVVAMAVVGGPAIDRVVVRVGCGAPGGHAGAERRVHVAARVVGIGLVGEGRGQDGDRRVRPRPRRQHVERQPVLAALAGQVQRVGAARQVRRHLQAGVGLPPAIVDVVVVEVDRGVVGRRMAPAGLAPAPVRADHAAGRQVHRLAVAGLRAGVGDARAADALREVPGREYVRLRWKRPGRRPAPQAAR